MLSGEAININFNFWFDPNRDQIHEVPHSRQAWEHDNTEAVAHLVINDLLSDHEIFTKHNSRECYIKLVPFGGQLKFQPLLRISLGT